MTPHKIELADETPIWQKPRIFSEPINNEIRELMSLDVIEYNTSEWSSPIVPVKKKNGDLRMCIDYRALNKKTKPSQFPMPNLKDSIYRSRNSIQN